MKLKSLFWILSIFLVALPLVSADYINVTGVVNQAQSVSLTTSHTTTQADFFRGIQLFPKLLNTSTYLNITSFNWKNSGTAPTQCRAFINGTFVKNATFSGYNCPIALRVGKNDNVTISGGNYAAVSYQSDYAPWGGLQSKTYLNFTCPATTNGLTANIDCAGNIHGVIGVDVVLYQDIIPGGLNISIFSPLNGQSQLSQSQIFNYSCIGSSTNYSSFLSIDNTFVNINQTVLSTNSNTLMMCHADSSENGLCYNSTGNFTPSSSSNVLFSNGLINQSFEFNGINSIINWSVPTIRNNASKSISLWFKINGNSTAATYEAIIDSHNGTGNMFGIYYDKSKGRILVDYTNITLYQPQLYSNNQILDNSWHHIYWSYNLSTFNQSFYIDGVYQNSTIIGGGVFVGSNSLVTMGNILTGLNLNGSIDEVLISSNILNSNQIFDLYNQSKYFFNIQNNTNLIYNATLNFGNHTSVMACFDNSLSTQQTILFNLAQQIENSSYVNVTEELNNTRFFLEIQALPTISNVTAFLNYNGTIHDLENNIDLAVYHFHFNDTVPAPLVDTNGSKVPFFWNYTIFYTNGSNFTNVSYFNQTVFWKIFNTANLTIQEYDQLGKQYIQSFTVNATNGTISQVISTTNGSAIFNPLLTAHENRVFNIRAYGSFLGNITTTYLVNYTTNNLLVLYPSILFNIFLIDEQSLLPFNSSKPSLLQVNFICSNSSTIFNVVPNISNFSYNVSCDLQKINTVVNYPSATTNYFRTLPYPSIVNYSFVKIYLIDALTTPYIMNTFQTFDLLGTYTSPKIIITKLINNREEVITGDFVDVSNKITAYLLQSNEYQITVNSLNQPDRIMGSYLSDTSTAAVLRLTDLTLSTDNSNSLSNIYSALFTYNDTGIYRVRAVVNGTDVTSSRFILKDAENGNLLMDSTSVNSGAIYTYTPGIGANCSRRYNSSVQIFTLTGNYTSSKLFRECNYIDVPAKFDDPNFMRYVLFFIITIIALSLTAYNSIYGTLLMVGALAFGVFVLGIPVGGVGTAIVGFLILIAVIYLLRSG